MQQYCERTLRSSQEVGELGDLREADGLRVGQDVELHRLVAGWPAERKQGGHVSTAHARHRMRSTPGVVRLPP
jgi:hypothetical protein